MYLSLDFSGDIPSARSRKISTAHSTRQQRVSKHARSPCSQPLCPLSPTILVGSEGSWALNPSSFTLGVQFYQPITLHIEVDLSLPSHWQVDLICPRTQSRTPASVSKPDSSHYLVTNRSPGLGICLNLTPTIRFQPFLHPPFQVSPLYSPQEKICLKCFKMDSKH
jgi:hypothetical protein